MISIEIMCIGKIKEKNLSALCEEYLKRLSKYAKITIAEFKDESLEKITSHSEEEKIKNIESDRIISKLDKMTNPYIIALDPHFDMYTSEGFSSRMDKIAAGSYSNIVFVIGGSLGISNKLLERANEKISFSKMTFPHQLFRVILLEQIYRSFKISKGETYHK